MIDFGLAVLGVWVSGLALTATKTAPAVLEVSSEAQRNVPAGEKLLSALFARGAGWVFKVDCMI